MENHLNDFDRFRLEAWSDVLDVERHGPVCSLLGPGLDHPMFNGVASEAPLDPAGVEQAMAPALARLRQAGVTRYLVQLTAPAPDDWLAKENLVPFRRWVRLVRGDALPAPAAGAREVVRVGPARAQEVGAVVCRSFGFPARGADLVARLVGRPGWHTYAVLDEGRVVAAGLLFANRGLGYLTMAGTLPSHRGRGYQSALIARRVQVAIDLGCRRILVETGEAVPGDPQHSFRNLRRHGFEPCGTLYNYTPADTETQGMCHDRTSDAGPQLVRGPSARARRVGIGGR